MFQREGSSQREKEAKCCQVMGPDIRKGKEKIIHEF